MIAVALVLPDSGSGVPPTVRTLIEFIRSVGFPIVVSAFVLLRLEASVQELVVLAREQLLMLQQVCVVKRE